LKKLVSLVMVVTVLLGVMVGCSSEPAYTEMTVGAMTLSIPADWQRPDEYEDILGSILTEDTEGWIDADVYEDKGGNALLFMETIDMVGYYGLQNWSWQGWDIELSESDMTKEDYTDYIQSGLMAGAAEITPLSNQPMTISGYESWDSRFLADDGEDITHICVVIVFAPDNVGVLQLMVAEDDWAEFEDIWTTVRDSISI
jgi:hypothetical protein